MIELALVMAAVGGLYGLAILGLSRLAGLNHRAEDRCVSRSASLSDDVWQG